MELFFVAGFIHSFEYSLQRWTPMGNVIAAKHKPARYCRCKWIDVIEQILGEGLAWKWSLLL